VTASLLSLSLYRDVQVSFSLSLSTRGSHFHFSPPPPSPIITWDARINWIFVELHPQLIWTPIWDVFVHNALVYYI
jgi:hypothetical protein